MGSAAYRDAVNFRFEPISSQLLVQAMDHQHQGELDRAESLVWQILADDPIAPLYQVAMSFKAQCIVEINGAGQT